MKNYLISTGIVHATSSCIFHNDWGIPHRRPDIPMAIFYSVIFKYCRLLWAFHIQRTDFIIYKLNSSILITQRFLLTVISTWLQLTSCAFLYPMGKYSLVYVIDTPSLLSITYIVFPVFPPSWCGGCPSLDGCPFGFWMNRTTINVCLRACNFLMFCV